MLDCHANWEFVHFLSQFIPLSSHWFTVRGADAKVVASMFRRHGDKGPHHEAWHALHQPRRWMKWIDLDELNDLKNSQFGDVLWYPQILFNPRCNDCRLVVWLGRENGDASPRSSWCLSCAWLQWCVLYQSSISACFYCAFFLSPSNQNFRRSWLSRRMGDAMCRWNTWGVAVNFTLPTEMQWTF